MLPPDAPMRERQLWAGLAAIVGIVHDGPELGTEQRFFQRIEAACRTFGVHGSNAESLLKVLGFHYHRGSDCYVSRDVWQELTLQDARYLPGTRLH